MQNPYQLGNAPIGLHTSILVAASDLVNGRVSRLALSRREAARCSAHVSSADENATSSAFDFRNFRLTNSPHLKLVKNDAWIGILPLPLADRIQTLI